MIKRLTIKNFTVFEDESLDFSEGINVVIGENGLGKSHILKLGYAITKAIYAESINPSMKEQQEQAITDRLAKIFRPDKRSIARLCTRNEKGQKHMKVSYTYTDMDEREIAFSFSRGGKGKKKSNITLEKALPQAQNPPRPIFIPTMEVMATLFENYGAIQKEFPNSFDETLFDLCNALDRSLQGRGRREPKVSNLIRDLEEILEGKVILQEKKFYIKRNA